MAVSRECLGRCREALLARRMEQEGRIKDLSAAPRPKLADFDKGVGFMEASAMFDANLNNAFRSLRETNLRIEAIRTGAFSGVCAECGHNMEEQTLIDNPMRRLCVDCQKTVNGKK